MFCPSAVSATILLLAEGKLHFPTFDKASAFGFTPEALSRSKLSGTPIVVFQTPVATSVQTGFWELTWNEINNNIIDSECLVVLKMILNSISVGFILFYFESFVPSIVSFVVKKRFYHKGTKVHTRAPRVLVLIPALQVP